MKFFLLDPMCNFNDHSLCFLKGSVQGPGLAEWKLNKGEPITADYPADSKMSMTDENPGIKLQSLVGNSERYLIAAPEFRRLVEEHVPTGVEYLPLTIIDHKKRVASKDYCLINPLGTVDSLDEVASKLKFNSKGRAIDMGELFLDRKKVEKVPQLFRPTRLPSRFIVGETLMEAITAAKLTNVVVEPMKFSN